jgi:ribonuclease HI
MEKLKKVTIYTDGACKGNPGPGGYGVVMIYGGHRKELWGGFRQTTNNRMEILAAVEGLSALRQKCAVTVYTDSEYVSNAINQGWAQRWRENGWKRNKKDMAVNPDLWQRLLDLCEKHEVQFLWVRGHAGNPENERCDQLAVEAACQPDLPPDAGYESSLG